MPYSPLHLTNNLLRRAFDSNVEVTPMELQRLLYFTAQEYAKLTGGAALAHESFRSWAAGPVLPSVFTKFRSVGTGPITDYSKDAAGNAHRVDERSDAHLSLALDRVWVQGQRLSGAELNRIATTTGSAWAKVGEPGAGDNILYSDLVEDDTYLEAFGLSHPAASSSSGHRA